MRTVTRLSQLTVAAALGLSLAACGSSSSTGSKTSAGQASGQSSSAAAPATSSSAPSSSAPSASANAGGDAAVPSATTLVHEARTAYNSAKNAKLHADMVDQGKKETIDVQGDVDGTNQDLTITTEDEGSATVRSVGGKNYIKGDKTFWRKSSGAPVATSALLADKWVTAPAKLTSGLESLNIKAILNSAMGPTAASDAKLKTAKSSKSTLNGDPIYLITTAKNNTIKLTTDTKYVLELKSDSGTMTFSGWNQQPATKAPDHPVAFPSSLAK